MSIQLSFPIFKQLITLMKKCSEKEIMSLQTINENTIRVGSIKIPDNITSSVLYLTELTADDGDIHVTEHMHNFMYVGMFKNIFSNKLQSIPPNAICTIKFIYIPNIPSSFIRFTIHHDHAEYENEISTIMHNNALVNYDKYVNMQLDHDLSMPEMHAVIKDHDVVHNLIPYGRNTKTECTMIYYPHELKIISDSRSKINCDVRCKNGPIQLQMQSTVFNMLWIYLNNIQMTASKIEHIITYSKDLIVKQTLPPGDFKYRYTTVIKIPSQLIYNFTVMTNSGITSTHIYPDMYYGIINDAVFSSAGKIVKESGYTAETLMSQNARSVGNDVYHHEPTNRYYYAPKNNQHSYSSPMQIAVHHDMNPALVNYINGSAKTIEIENYAHAVYPMSLSSTQIYYSGK